MNLPAVYNLFFVKIVPYCHDFTSRNDMVHILTYIAWTPIKRSISTWSFHVCLEYLLRAETKEESKAQERREKH